MQLARSLSYTPIATSSLLEQSTGKALQQIQEEDGPAGVAIAEAMVLESLCTFARCSISTLGDGAAHLCSHSLL